MLGEGVDVPHVAELDGVVQARLARLRERELLERVGAEAQQRAHHVGVIMEQ